MSIAHDAATGAVLGPSAIATVEPRRFIVRLPLPPMALSPNVASHRHWSHRHKATKGYRAAAKVAFQRDRPRGFKAAHVTIEMDYYCTKKSAGYRPRDIGNAFASIKAAIDGFVDAGMVPSDARAFVSWGGLRLHSSAKDVKHAPPEHQAAKGCVILTINPS